MRSVLRGPAPSPLIARAPRVCTLADGLPCEVDYRTARSIMTMLLNFYCYNYIKLQMTMMVKTTRTTVLKMRQKMTLKIKLKMTLKIRKMMMKMRLSSVMVNKTYWKRKRRCRKRLKKR